MQKEIGRIGSVPLGVGFGRGFKKERLPVVPKNILVEFLSVKPTTKEAVQMFCSKYQIIPRDMRNGFLAGFIQEQAKILSLYSNFAGGTLSQKDLDLINDELAEISPKLMYMSGNDAALTNLWLVPAVVEGTAEPDYESLADEDIKVPSSYKEPHTAFKCKNTIALLWFELAKLITSNTKLRNCRNCGKYFIPTVTTKLNCNDTCKDQYNSRRRRTLKRIKK